jgi:hypothetical protein
MWTNDALFILYECQEIARTHGYEVGRNFLIFRITKILESISKKAIEAHVTNLFLEVCVNDRDGKPIQLID